VILPKSIKISVGWKISVVLLLLWVYLFRFTAQGPPVAVPPIPSAPNGWRGIRSFHCCIPGPANNNNDGQAQPLTEANVEREALTTFHQDLEPEKASISNYLNIGSGLRSSTMDQRTHDLKEFLRRPVLCWTGTYSVTSSVGSPLVSMAMPSSCIAKSSYKEKMRGFYGFRAKMVIRVQLNGQRFQQGRLILSYLPESSEMQPERKFTSLYCLQLLTQQPRMDIDVANDTEAIMEIPFVSNNLYASLLDDTFDYGTFYLTPYTALRVGAGASNVKIGIWCHFEDVEIVYPTIPGLLTQSGIRRKKGRGGSSTGGVDTTDQELNQTGLGPISGLAKRISNSAGVLSEIPLISAFTAPVSWAADIVSRSALALGYSKPAIEGPFARGVPTVFPNMHNVDAVDNSNKLAMSVRNKIENLPGFAGTDVDEMTISHIVQIPSYVGTYSWSTAAAVGTALVHYGTGPRQYGTIIPLATSTGTKPIEFGPVLGYLANAFRFWRGGITFHFKVVKTEFHSGRLMFAYMPGLNRAATDSTFDGTQYLYKEIFDLRTSSEFSVTIPYVGLTPYTRTDWWTGICSLWILNPLTAPDTVSPSVDIILEVCGAEDTEFGAPKQWGPDTATNPKVPCLIGQSGLVKPALQLSGLKPQGMAPKLSNGGDVHGQEDGETVTQSQIMTTLEPAKFCMGERILSLRQLLKVSSSLMTGAATAKSAFYIAPFVTQNNVFQLGAAQAAAIPCDFYSYYVSMFRYYRGGVRIKFGGGLTAFNTAYVCRLVSSFRTMGRAVDDYGSSVEDGSGIVTNMDSSIYTNSAMGMFPEIEVPYYGHTHARHVYNASAYNPVQTELSVHGHLLHVNCGATSFNTHIYRSVADDFSAGFFIGCLPLGY
jgi:hypothetical protein